jgi:hypothetical protein
MEMGKFIVIVEDNLNDVSIEPLWNGNEFQSHFLHLLSLKNKKVSIEPLWNGNGEETIILFHRPLSQSNHCGMEKRRSTAVAVTLQPGLNRTIVEWKCSLTIALDGQTVKKSQSNHSGMEMSSKVIFYTSFLSKTRKSQSNHCGMEIYHRDWLPKSAQSSLNRTIVEWKSQQGTEARSQKPGLNIP